jgi:hypothetical protein
MSQGASIPANSARPLNERPMLTLEPAAPAMVSRWRYWAFGTAGTSGLLSLAGEIHSIFPAERLQHFADYESFIFVAFAIALITGLFLLVTDKVIAVSFAQLGATMSLLYIGYSLVGIFAGAFMPVFYIVMALGILLMAVVFGQSIQFLRRYGRTADVILASIFLLGALLGGAFPLYSNFLPLLTGIK